MEIIFSSRDSINSKMAIMTITTHRVYNNSNKNFKDDNNKTTTINSMINTNNSSSRYRKQTG